VAVGIYAIVHTQNVSYLTNRAFLSFAMIARPFSARMNANTWLEKLCAIFGGVFCQIIPNPTEE